MQRLARTTAAICAVCGALLLIHGCGGDEATAPSAETACGITVTHPAPGSRHLAGEDVNLRWEASGGGQVRICLIRSAAEQGEVAATTDNDGFFRWVASNTGGPPDDGYAVVVPPITRGGPGLPCPVPIGYIHR